MAQPLAMPPECGHLDNLAGTGAAGRDQVVAQHLGVPISGALFSA